VVELSTTKQVGPGSNPGEATSLVMEFVCLQNIHSATNDSVIVKCDLPW